MEDNEQQAEKKVDMPAVRRQDYRNCYECYHSSGPVSLMWCHKFDKPTSGKTCDGFQRYAIKLPKW